MVEGNYAQAVAQASEALSIGRRLGSTRLIFDGLTILGRLDLLQEQTLKAAEMFEESLAYARRKEHKGYIARALFNLGLLAWATGELERASPAYTEALTSCQEAGEAYLEAIILCELGKVAFKQGDINEAKTLFKRVYVIKDLFHYFVTDPYNPAMLTLEATAILAAVQGQGKGNTRRLVAATCLLGATEVEHKKAYFVRLPRERQEREACIAALRLTMSERDFTAAWAQGQSMALEQAVEYAKGLMHPE